jgi:hypothetical protein
MPTVTRLLSMSLVLAATGLGSAQPGFARENGVNCKQMRKIASPTLVPNITYSSFGVHNGYDVPLKVFCSGGTPGNSPPAVPPGIAVDVYDRHKTRDVCCTGQLQNPDGSLILANTRCSRDWNTTSQALSIPLARAGGFVNLVCEIPPIQPADGTGAGGLSHVTNYHVFPAE